MTLIIIGPVCHDLIIKPGFKMSKTGGASYFQSFVFEEFHSDYMIITNSSSPDIVNEFPVPSKVKLILKDDSHYFINEYPDPDNTDFRCQLTNFANIPITADDLRDVLKNVEIDAFILNPLNCYDFPKETVDYIKSFKKPIFASVQGFIREKGELKDNYFSINLHSNDAIFKISDIDVLFLDENEAKIISADKCNISQIIITNGSKGSRVIADEEYLIKAVFNDNICDATGCGDTFMAAYISQFLKSKSVLKSANFASEIASLKLSLNGPFQPLI